jgi:DNA-binding NtrC family response regulator
VSIRAEKILVVDDDEDVLFALRLLLKKHVDTIHTEKNPKTIPTLLKNESYDVIFLDMNFERDSTSGYEGFYWLDQILKLDPSAVVILVTAYGDVEMAVRAIKEGAIDFVLKPWQNEKLLATLSAALKLRQSRIEVSSLRSQKKQLSADLDQPFKQIVGSCPAMQHVFDNIQKVAGTDANILILGENGTGKELVARELHRQSLRSEQVFIVVDVGSLSENLFESELFGHEKGAYTGAAENRAGRFEIASGGTLFLDEIGNISLPLQAKLLTVLENREIIRVGSNIPHAIDIRLICATNMEISELVEQNRFRQDLLYRINTVEINLPPLRERKEDIPHLVQYFINIFARKYKKSIKRVNASALKKLERYYWPGNVRELQHAIERALILTESDVIQSEDFSFSAPDVHSVGLHLDNYNLEEVEKIIIRKTLSKHGGNISHAAGELGLTRASLYRRLEKYGL